MGMNGFFLLITCFVGNRLIQDNLHSDILEFPLNDLSGLGSLLLSLLATLPAFVSPDALLLLTLLPEPPLLSSSS